MVVRTLLAIVVGSAIGFAVFGLDAPPVDAHPKPKTWGSGVPGIHKIACGVTGHFCDKPPRPGPQHPCTAERAGEVVPVWDERLGAYVNWECRCEGGDCRWFRLGIVHRARMPWEACWRLVIDFHRACASIVCEYRAREHRYPIRRNALWCG